MFRLLASNQFGSSATDGPLFMCVVSSGLMNCYKTEVCITLSALKTQGPRSHLVGAAWRVVVVMLEIGLGLETTPQGSGLAPTVTVKTPAAACVHSVGDTLSDLPSL